jgi:hypothetical protein
MSESRGSEESLRQRREAIVREHMDSENRHDFDTTIATFDHPRYELVPTGDVFDGEQEVRAYFAESRTAFPNQRNEVVALHDADDAVIVEFDLLTIMRRLGLAHETTSVAGRLSMMVSHPVTIGRAIAGSLVRRSQAR